MKIILLSALVRFCKARTYWDDKHGSFFQFLQQVDYLSCLPLFSHNVLMQERRHTEATTRAFETRNPSTTVIMCKSNVYRHFDVVSPSSN